MSQKIEQECCGKNCGEKNGLKLGMGWNRYHTNKNEMITNQLFCVDCFYIYTSENCKSCDELLPYTELKFAEGGAFGNSTNNSKQFFCKKCFDEIIKIDYDPDEWK